MSPELRGGTQWHLDSRAPAGQKTGQSSGVVDEIVAQAE